MAIKQLNTPGQGTPQGTSEATKQADIKNSRIEVIATADDLVNISEPSSPSHGQYPWVKIEKSLAGHIIEVDDTPGAERLLTMHKTGTFEEIHPDGTRVVKIFGDDFHISLKDRSLVVGGNLNITVQGNANLLVNGSMKQKINGDLETVVLGNMTTKVKGDIKISSDKNLALEAQTDLTARSQGQTKIYSKGALNVVSDSTTVLYSSTTRIYSSGGTYIQGSQVRINDGGGKPQKITVAYSGLKLGLGKADSVLEPSADAVIVASLDNASLSSIVAVDAITYPKDRTKS